MGFDGIDGHRHGITHGNLVADDPLRQSARVHARSLRECAVGRAAVERAHAVEPGFHQVLVRLQPLRRRDLGLLVAIQDAGHHLALAPQREGEIREQTAHVRALRAVALARHGVDRRAAEVRTEHRVPAGQIFQIEAHVHGVGLPREKHDGLLVPHGAFDLGQLALFARLDQLEVPKAELVVLDHLEDQPIAVVAGLDAVDGPVQLGGEAVDIVEVLEPQGLRIRRHGQRVLGAFKIRTNDDHRAVGVVGGPIGDLGRHPIAEEDVDVVVLDRREGHRHGQHGDRRGVPDVAEELCGERGGRGHVGPAHVGKSDRAAARRIGRGGRGRRLGACGQGSCGAEQQGTDTHQPGELDPVVTAAA